MMTNAKHPALVGIICLLFLSTAHAQWNVPERTQAGQDVTIRASLDVYVVGPGFAAKLKPENGSVTIKGDQLRNAGRYLVSNGQNSAVMWVEPSEPAKLNFLAQPSRVPAARPGVISGTAFVFDNNENLVLSSTPVKFDLRVEGAPTISRTVDSRDGVAWIRSDSSRREGNAEFTAAVGGIGVKRIVRQVAAEPCNLSMRARPEKKGILVETAPVRDCSGNAVPDGTIVTFTQLDSKGKTTVDARVKKGVAAALLPPADSATISVASGVVMGNEIRWGGRQ